MEKREDIFFEVVLRNSAAILTKASQQKDNQNAKLAKLKSTDRTADAAIDNIYGGQMTIDINGNMTHLRNLQQWAGIITQARKHFDSLSAKAADKIHKNMADIYQLCYMEGRSNREALKKMRIARPVFFAAKSEIKNYIRAAACEMGIWRIFVKKF